MSEYHAQQAHTAANTARLKALRLAEADRHPLSSSEHPKQAIQPVGDNARKPVKQRSRIETKVVDKTKLTKRKGPSGNQFRDLKQQGKLKSVRRET